ncbi:MAG: phosphoribosylformylglycinamidine synthase subunit PurS [Bacteroidia bacterium]|nr:phosphoribosylformylglycinamidine synthase subunit PurS [Bacteroidia bacterium]
MKYTARINVMPQKALLDPQGKAVTATMKNLNLPEIENVRIGKHITMEVEAPDKATAEEKVKIACEKLLANPVMETFEFSIEG